VNLLDKQRRLAEKVRISEFPWGPCVSVCVCMEWSGISVKNS
jgi:hypothetical protein